MRVDWYVNGQPVMTASRVRAGHDFGFVTCDIAGSIPEDSGIYTVRAMNAVGDAMQDCKIVVIRMFGLAAWFE
jgi:hypothetical protein